MSEDYDENHGLAKEKEAKFRLEGALGYALRIGKSIQDGKVKSIEELNRMIDEDCQRASTALAFHFRDDLEIDGFAVGLFNDDLKKETE